MIHRSVCLCLCLLLLAGGARSEVHIAAPGGSDALLDNLRARLALQSEPCDAPDWRVRRLFARAAEEFRPALRAFGYYSATLDKQLEMGGDCWQARFTIQLGERVRVRERDVVVHGEAAQDEALPALLNGLPLAQGEALNHARYEEIKQRLRSFAAERGYLDFRLTRQELRVYPDQAAAEISIAADSGERYRFGAIGFSEQPLDENFVRRLGATREGDAFDAAALIALDRNLSDSGYFNQVAVRPRRAAAQDGVIPVDVELTPAARHAWRFGIGFATDTGPRGSLRYDNRYVNSLGHSLASELQLSPVESGLNVDYVIPGEDPHHESFSFGAALRHEDSDRVESDSAILAGRHTLKQGGWTQVRFIELLHERSQVGDDETEATLLMPGISFERVQADDLLRVHDGYRLYFEARGAYEGLLSDATLLQLRANAKGIHRFGEGGRVTARAHSGFTLGDGIGSLPASLRFFAGGDNSVRGYEYKSLGPENRDGDTLGGRHLLTASLEYEHPVVDDDWWLAAFVDAGNAFDTDQFDLKVGYGGGLRWYSPIGRLRLDLAFPQDDRADDWRIHFGLGADL